MKKILIILLILSVTLFFVACPHNDPISGDSGDGGDSSDGGDGGVVSNAQILPVNPVSDDIYVEVNSLTLSWEVIDYEGDVNNLTFNVYLQNTSDFTFPVNPDPLNTTSYTVNNELYFDTLYYWKVRAFDENSYHVATSDLWTFTTGPDLVAISPESGDTGAGTESTTLNWNIMGYDNLVPLTYDVYFGSDSASMSQIADDITDTALAVTDPTSLSTNTMYYWQVVANLPQSKTATSEVWSFTTTSTASYPPTKPTFIYPTDEDTGISAVSLDLEWTQSTDNESDPIVYDIYLAEDGELFQLYATESVNDPTTTKNITRLNYNTTYVCRVVARESNGVNQTPSDLLTFTTETPTGTIEDFEDDPGSNWVFGGDQVPYLNTDPEDSSNQVIKFADNLGWLPREDSWAGVYVEVPAGGGEMAFDLKVDSRADENFFYFYIDGILFNDNPSEDENLEGVGGSGNMPWQSSGAIMLPEGKHTLVWQYEKSYADEEYSNDTAYIDNVFFEDGITVLAPAPIMYVSQAGYYIEDGTSFDYIGTIESDGVTDPDYDYTLQFGIRNVGLANGLDVGTLQIDNNPAGTVMTIGSQPDSATLPVSMRSFTTFTLTVDDETPVEPTTATITIPTSNAGNIADNDYTFTADYEVIDTSLAQIEVQDLDGNVVDSTNGFTDYADYTLDAQTEFELTIINNGYATLTLTNSPNHVTVSPTDAGIAVTQPSTSTIDGIGGMYSNTRSLYITYTGDDTETNVTATISINYDDSNVAETSPYTFDITVKPRNPITIDDFGTAGTPYTEGQAPTGNWEVGVDSTYSGTARGPVVTASGETDFGLELMDMALSDGSNDGSEYTGYTYATLTFTPTTTGAVSFDFKIDNSYGGDVELAEFWLDQPTDIANATDPDWTSGDLGMYSWGNIMIDVTTIKEYTFTWKCTKTASSASGEPEDLILLDNLRYWAN